MEHSDILFQPSIIDAQFMEDAHTLVTDYYHNTEASKGLPLYNFDWPLYVTMEPNMVITTARAKDGGELLGFTMYFVIQHPHHYGLRVAECDTIAVGWQHRGKGVGKALYYYTEPLLLSRGATRIVHRHRAVYGDKSMFPGLGFEVEETVYVKRV